MGHGGAIIAFAAREGGEEAGDALPEINRQAQHRTQLDHDGVHLPERIVERKAEQFFRDAQVRGGADRQELRKALDNPQKSGEQIVVQKFLRG